LRQERAAIRRREPARSAHDGGGTQAFVAIGWTTALARPSTEIGNKETGTEISS
jgi:hypothetical protein